jgi:hypothetical protein
MVAFKPGHNCGIGTEIRTKYTGRFKTCGYMPLIMDRPARRRYPTRRSLPKARSFIDFKNWGQVCHVGMVPVSLGSLNQTCKEYNESAIVGHPKRRPHDLYRRVFAKFAKLGKCVC